jgi:hypothetical protein
VHDVNLRLYRVLETGRTVEIESPNIWESYSSEEIIFYECGNYLLVAETKALSGDGRVIKAEQFITVTPYVQRGYHEFSWENEDLVQLTPSDEIAINTFLKEEIEIDFILTSEKVKNVNSFGEGYLFYKDSTRSDTILYQKDAKITSGESREMYFIQVKDASQRYWYIYWDDCVVSVSRNAAVNYGGSGSSSLGGVTGGGQSPSPSIGGESPSPSI